MVLGWEKTKILKAMIDRIGHGQGQSHCQHQGISPEPWCVKYVIPASDLASQGLGIYTRTMGRVPAHRALLWWALKGVRAGSPDSRACNVIPAPVDQFTSTLALYKQPSEEVEATGKQFEEVHCQLSLVRMLIPASPSSTGKISQRYWSWYWKYA